MSGKDAQMPNFLLLAGVKKSQDQVCRAVLFSSSSTETAALNRSAVQSALVLSL